MADILPDVEGDIGRIREATPVVIVDASGVVPVSAKTRAIVDVDLTAVTTGLLASEVVADTQVVANMARVNDGTVVLESVTVIDPDDTGNTLDLLFLSANVSLGAEGGLPSISDANANSVVAKVSIATTDWTDLGGVRVATVGNLRRFLKPASGTRDVYVAATAGATVNAQFAGGTIRVRLGYEMD